MPTLSVCANPQLLAPSTDPQRLRAIRGPAAAIGGAVLIAAGATFEKRRRDVARIRDGLRAMR